MYQAYALHFFNEFRSRLELDVDDPMQSARTNQQQMRHMLQKRNSSMTQDRRGDQTSTNRIKTLQSSERRQLGERGSYQGSQDYREDRQEDQRYNNQSQERDQSIEARRGRRNELPQSSPTKIEESGGHVNSYTKTNQSNLTKSRRAASKSKIFNQAGLNTIMEQSYHSNVQPQTNEEKRILEKQYKGYIRVGDIISLSFQEKVFEKGKKEAKEGTQNNMMLAKIIDTPELEYKGLLFSDGVTNKQFSIIPKSPDFSTNGSSLFKKCLFRVEIAYECFYNIQYQKLEAELVELEQEREEIDDNNYDDIERIQDKLEEVEEKIKKNMKMLKEETKNNEYEFKMNLGKKITYGQKIQLRHIFSNQFLTLNTKKISQEHGCVQLQLSETNEHSWFMLMPSQKIRQVGQSIAYLDTYFLQNYVEKTKFYLHINISDIQGQNGGESVLEVNGSHEPSRLRSKLFIDFNHLLAETNNVHSGDSVRFYHKESAGYLTSNEKEVELLLPELPDYLQKQIRALQGIKKNDFKNDDDDQDIRALQQDEEKRLLKNKIYVERNQKNLYFTNSCWEIQKMQPFKGGSSNFNFFNLLLIVTWDGFYRIRHIGTGKYLAVANDKLELTFKNQADFTDTLFTIRKDSYCPGDPMTLEEAIITGSPIILETFNRTYLQIYKEFETDETAQFDFKISNENQINLPNSAQSQVPIACGFFSKDDLSKMVFQIQEIPNEKALISYQGASFFQTFLEFYDFLNIWAVISIEDDEEAIDNMRYDPQAAIATESDLEQCVDDIKQVLSYLMQILHDAKEQSRDKYIIVQKQLAEQGLLQILIKLIELIYYKTTPQEDREVAFQNERIKRKRQEVEDNEAEIIAREYLDPLAEKILRVLHMMIKLNQHNSEKVTKYDSIIYSQLSRYDTKLIANIFKETFKRAQFIFGDKSASITHSEGIDTKALDTNIESAVGNQFNSSLSNQINKWADMLDTVYLVSEYDENISKQILYLNVISMICRDQNGKGIHHFQVQAAYNILESEQNTPLRFGVQKRDIDRPFVYFVRKPRETGEIFFQKNPMLRDIYKAPASAAYTGDSLDIIFDLQEMSQKAEALMPYIDYIAAVIDLYSHMCLSRNHVAIQKVKDIGLSYDHIITCINNKHIHEKLKSSYIFAAKVLFIDNDPFPTVLAYKNRCYFWDALSEAEAHRTMYKWEKQKQILNQQSRVQNQELELCEEAVQQVRKNVNEFFKKGPSDIIEFLYGWQRKRYSKKDIDPKLKLLINYITTATSLIECEHTNASFINRMLKTAALVLISYHTENLSEQYMEHWIVKLLKVSKNIKACRNKIEILEYKILQMLQVMCKFRLNQQILMFLKMFKQFEEQNEQPHINVDITKFDGQFQQLFQLHQFNIDQMATHRRILQFNKYQQVEDAIKIEEIVVQEDKNKKQMEEDDEEEKAKKKSDLRNRKDLVNKKIPLDELLLYLVFAKSTNEKIRDQAIQVLVTNFNQRESFVQEVVKIELIISEEDIKEYQGFKFQHYRLNGLIEQMIHDDLYYLLYQIIDKEKYKISIGDIIDILKGLTSNLLTTPSRLSKKQNMLRHLDISNDLITKLMKNIYFREQDHFLLMTEISNFLFMYSYKNPNNQRSLLPHLNYLVTLTDKNINTPKLISQIIINNRDSDYGMNFMQFVINKITNNNMFKSSLLRLLNIMAVDNSSNQVFILKRLIKKKRFRKRLYMDTESNTKKIELVLALKKKMIYLQQTQLKQQKLDEDKERVDLHLATADLLSTCSKNNMFGIMQARKLISVESLFDSLLSEAVPFLFKKSYFRLLYEVYIDDVKDITSIDINSLRFIEVMKYVVLEDLKQYSHYYLGLMTKTSPEARRDNQIEKEREKVHHDLDRQSKQQIQRMNMDKNQKDIEEYKEFKSRLSALKSNKPFPLINDADLSEYWSYLTKFKKSNNKADGLLHFIQDFYRNVKKSKIKMSKELIDITIKVRETLMAISDELHKLLETYKDFLMDIDSMLYHISQAISSIPNVRTFKAGKKFNIKGGGDEEKEKAESDESEGEELDESKVLDIRLASDKILRIVRDYIISNNQQIREAFKIQSIQTDYQMKKFDFKKILKEISGTEASFEEIEKAIQFFTSFSKEQQQERKIMQVEIGQEGHIKLRQDPNSIENNELLNFRDFEILLKKILSKAGYKPPHQKKERVIDENFELKMIGGELSIACNNDLKHYIKCFFDFYQRFKGADELKDIVDKIVKKFSDAFRTNKIQLIVIFIQNMMKGFENGEYKIYLIKILNMILEGQMPENYKGDKELQKMAKIRLHQLQQIMNDNGICKLLLGLISQDESPEVAMESIKLLSSLLSESNTYVQQSLLNMMKLNKDNFQFFAYIKDRLIKSTDQLIVDIEQKFLLDRAKALSQEKEQGGLQNLHSQPFYLPNQFDLENEFDKLQKRGNSNELLNILKLLQLLCDNCFAGFQNYLRDQEEGDESSMVTSVNLVVEVANCLIKLTLRLDKLIFSDFSTYETIPQVFHTLIDFLYGPCRENQIILGPWRKLYKVINIYLEQDMGYYVSNTTENKSKLSIFNLCTYLLLALIDQDNNEDQKLIMEVLIKEINLRNLKQKLVDIFKYKIGGGGKKLLVYYANKRCNHYKMHGLVRHNMCEKNEFCEFSHMIPFDNEIITSGFNIFILMLQLKDIIPNDENLVNFKFDIQKNYRGYNYYHFMDKLEDEALITPEQLRQKILDDESRLNDDIDKRIRQAEELLQKIAIQNPLKRMFDEGQVEEANNNKNDMLDQGIDGKKGLQSNIEDDFDDKGGMHVIRRRSTQVLYNKQSICKRLCCIQPNHTASFYHKFWRFLFCCSCMQCCKKKRRKNQGQILAEEGIKKEHTQLITKAEEDELDDFKDIKKSMREQYLNDEIYNYEQFKLDEAFRFYISNVSSIEIDLQFPFLNNITFSQGKLIKVLFTIPPYCTYLSERTQLDIIYNAKRSSQQEKLEDFFSKIKFYRAEMKTQQTLARKSKFLKWLANRWYQLSSLCFSLVLLINLFFIIFYTIKRQDDQEIIVYKYDWGEFFIEFCVMIQTLIAFIVIIAYYLEYEGVIREKCYIKSQVFIKDRLTNTKGSLGYAAGAQTFNLINTLELKQDSNQIDKSDHFKAFGNQFLQSVKIFFLGYAEDSTHLFNSVYFIISLVGVFYNQIYCVLLLDVVIKIPLLTSVVQAIVQNKKQLFYTFILLFVIVYIYSYIAFQFFRANYLNSEDDPNANINVMTYCDTLFSCFMSTLNTGVRSGGGIGDALDSVQRNEPLYWGRFAFDLTFFFIIIILLLNLIFGIIIDAFASMRDDKNFIEEDVTNKCFICGISRFEFEIKNKSWFDHIMKEHNVYSYLYFILYVWKKSENECTGVEKYVKEKILTDDISFFPLNKCLAFAGIERQEKV